MSNSLTYSPKASFIKGIDKIQVSAHMAKKYSASFKLELCGHLFNTA